jgi:hypothetical protein
LNATTAGGGCPRCKGVVFPNKYIHKNPIENYHLTFLDIDFASVSTVSLLDFGTVPTVRYFYFSFIIM